MQKALTFFLVLYALMPLRAQTAAPKEKAMSANDYIEKYKEIAIAEMERSGIPASVTLAQGIRESSNGNSQLAKEAKNHFGIKCGNNWEGGTFYMWDDDPEQSCFRVYTSVEDSYSDHSDFLMRGRRYKPLFQLDNKDYKAWSEAVREAGYATDPDYPKKLIVTIEQYKLYVYDTMRMSVLAIPEDSIDAEAQFLVDLNDRRPLRSKKMSPLFLEYKKGIHRKNNTSFVYVKHNESALAVANRFAIPYKKFLRFNDIQQGDEFLNYQYAFIEPKKRRYSGDEEFHIVKDDETMYEISQFYALRLDALYSLNGLSPSSEPRRGEKVWLKKGSSHQPPRVRPINDSIPSMSVMKDSVLAVKPPKPSPKEFEPITYTSSKPQRSEEYSMPSTRPNNNPLQNPINKPRYAGDGYQDSSTDPTQDRTQSLPHGNILPKEELPKETPKKEEPIIVVSSVPQTKPQPTAIGTDNNRSALAQAASQNLPRITFTPAPDRVNKIPQPDLSPVKVPAPAPQNNSVKHIVKKNEGLYRISVNYGVSMDVIRKANNIKSDMLYEGQELIIPNQAPKL